MDDYMKNKIYLLLVLTFLGILVRFSYGTDERPDFFICNYWEDKNGDGILNDDEYVGIKSDFNTANDTIITFVSYFYDSKGKEIDLKIYDPDDALYADDSAVVEYEPTHVHRWWFNPSNMVEEGGAGDWSAEWYLDGELVHTEYFTISELTTTKPDFFACNYWEDKNDDGYMGREEFVGIKNTFSVEDDTSITCVSYWHNSKGKIITIKIFDPKGYIWSDDTTTVEEDETYIYYWNFNTLSMASEGGLGNWTVKWYLDDEFTNSIIINFYKKYETTKLMPQFFTCNYWKDLDNNGYIAENLSEFIGIKNTFKVEKDTEISFISHWLNKQGMIRKIVITAPDGTIWKSDTLRLKSDEVYWHPAYHIESMYNKGGAGTWTVKWYLNDVFIESKDFTIIK